MLVRVDRLLASGCVVTERVERARARGKLALDHHRGVTVVARLGHDRWLVDHRVWHAGGHGDLFSLDRDDRRSFETGVALAVGIPTERQKRWPLDRRLRRARARLATFAQGSEHEVHVLERAVPLTVLIQKRLDRLGHGADRGKLAIDAREIGHGCDHGIGPTALAKRRLRTFAESACRPATWPPPLARTRGRRPPRACWGRCRRPGRSPAGRRRHRRPSPPAP